MNMTETKPSEKDIQNYVKTLLKECDKQLKLTNIIVRIGLLVIVLPVYLIRGADKHVEP